MDSNVQNLSVRIARFVDESQPGWVECDFVDSDQHRHILIDKVPVFTSELLDASSQYPQPGSLSVQVLGRWRDAQGRELIRISTGGAAFLESVEGLTEFVVLSAQLSA